MKNIKHYLFVALALLLIVGCQSPFPKGKPGTFTLGNKEFLLNGKPFLIRAGEIHFPRIPREYWEHRIQMVKAMGMNTICIYVFWNFHEQKEGQFDFTGQRDIAEFARLVQKNDMYLIVRPGPYVCAEWDMGGLPWWLLKKKDVKVRTKDDRYFMERSDTFIQEVGKQLRPYQIENGGNIIMVQVENEYGAFGNDGSYMEEVRDITRKAFDKATLFRCDWGSNFDSYELDGVATTLNFGAGSDVDKQFERFAEQHPEAPLMCSEYWTGWFDHWGRPHETRSIESFIGSLKDMLDRNVSFSLFMAHGGTTFGQWGGGNAPPYSSMVTSYDYNAPINEAGQPTDKFYAVRDLLKNYLNEGETLAAVPPNIEMISIPEFELQESAQVFDNLPEAKTSKEIQSMEMFDQGWGSMIYRTQLLAGEEGRKLKITRLGDWARVFVDGKGVGKLDRRRNENTVVLPETATGVQLDILVDAMGRVNFGEAVIDRKGITEKVEVITGQNSTELKNWEVFNFPVNADFQRKVKFTGQKPKGPAWFKTTFNLEKTGDTYLDMSTWGKGMVWVNGKNIGRYWKIGPQQTLFMPGAWLKEGTNEIIVLDLENDPTQPKTIKGVTVPILDKINPEKSLLNRKDGQMLNLTNEPPIMTATLKNQKTWQKVDFGKTVNGRYFCFEAISSYDENKPFASMAELRLLDENGQVLPVLEWKVVYADSEEISGVSHTADKIFDNQESTFWHTDWRSNKPDFPHQLVIDLGTTTAIRGMNYLSRTDNSETGNVKSFNVYVKQQPFDLGN